MTWSAGAAVSRAKSNEVVKYNMDARSSQFRVHAFASGLISAVAHSPKFEIRDWVAETKAVRSKLEAGRLRVSVNASGLELVDDVRETERREIYRVMHSEVLETSKFPDIVRRPMGRVGQSWPRHIRRESRRLFAPARSHEHPHVRCARDLRSR
jgi:hypothetical protein